MISKPPVRPGVQKRIDASKKLLAQRDAALARMKAMKFDTIAVHGLYTVEEAIERNQGSVMEPLYLSCAEAYADSDELEAALAYLIPAWVYTRIANPTTYYLEWVFRAAIIRFVPWDRWRTSLAWFRQDWQISLLH